MTITIRNDAIFLSEKVQEKTDQFWCNCKPKNAHTHVLENSGSWEKPNFKKSK